MQSDGVYTAAANECPPPTPPSSLTACVNCAADSLFIMPMKGMGIVCMPPVLVTTRDPVLSPLLGHFW